jgi:WD40 repeat protein
MRVIFALVGLSFWAATSFAAPTGGQLMYLGVWPHTVLVMDSAQGKIVDKIDLPTDIVRTLVLSPDEKTLYGSTLKDNSIVSIDLATRKVVDKFSLNTSDTNYRIGGFAVDPTGKFIYTFATPVVKKIDHYQIDPPQILEVSLAERKITRTPSGSRPMESSSTCSATTSWSSTPATLNSSGRSSSQNRPTPPATAPLPGW